MLVRLGITTVGALAVACASSTGIQAAEPPSSTELPPGEPAPDDVATAVREPDDPRTCVTISDANQQRLIERNALRQRVATVLDDWAECLAASAVPNGRQLAFEISGGPGGGTSLHVRAGDPEMCAAKPCLEEAIRAKLLPAPQTGPDRIEAEFSGTLTYFPMTSSKVSLDEPLRSPTIPAACGERPGLTALDVPAPDFVQGVLHREADGLDACYARGLAHAPDLAGDLVTEITIRPGGQVARARTRSNTLPDCEVVSCVRALLAKLTYPWQGEQNLTVAVWTRFEPTDDSLPNPDRQRELPRRGPEFQPPPIPIRGPRDGFDQQLFWGATEGG